MSNKTGRNDAEHQTCRCSCAPHLVDSFCCPLRPFPIATRHNFGFEVLGFACENQIVARLLRQSKSTPVLKAWEKFLWRKLEVQQQLRNAVYEA